MKQRGELACSKKILKIDEEKRKTQTILQNLLAERKKLSKEIGLLKSQQKNATVILKKVEKINLNPKKVEREGYYRRKFEKTVVNLFLKIRKTVEREEPQKTNK